MQGTVNVRAHPRCINAGNPVHECSNYCFKRIAEQEEASASAEAGTVDSLNTRLPDAFGRPSTGWRKRGDESQSVNDAAGPLQAVPEADVQEIEEPADREDEQPDPAFLEGMTDRERKVFELRMKLNQARKANQTAVVAEKKRKDAPTESRGVSRQKWYDDKKKKIGKQLESNGLEMNKAYMLDTQEEAEAKYKKWDKKEAAFGWDIFNQKSLYNAYKNRTKNINITMEEYIKARDADPEFYRDESSLQYGKQTGAPAEAIDRMVTELDNRAKMRKDFSRRRKFHDEKDIDSINDRNEHFNRKIERAFGKYTVEIRNNLERGTALPD